MKGTILLVDDSDLDLELAQMAFERLGFERNVVVARGGVEALAYLSAPAGEAAGPRPPSLVLLDLKMPRMDGHDVLAALRARPAVRSVPVVMFSASADPRDIERSYALGADGYVVKPMSFEQLTDALERVCGFWLGVNEPPPGSARALRVVPQARPAP